MKRWVLLFVLAACAGCGSTSGGGFATPVGPETASPSAAPGPTVTPAVNAPRSYIGTRTITVTGTPAAGGPGAATYSAGAVETDQAPGAGTPVGTTLVRHLQVTYSGGAPTQGIQLQSRSLDTDAALGAAGLALIQTVDVTTGLDADASSHAAPGTVFTNVDTALTTFPAGAIVIPQTAGTIAFPLGAMAHLTIGSVETAGPFIGTTTNGTNFVRSTNPDGSFDEPGQLTGFAGQHAMHQNADGSATSHDQIPGFSLRDVAIGAPSGTGTTPSLAVTVQTQGRTVGNPPIVTTTYTTPVWYAPGALAAATLYDSMTTSLPAGCGTASVAVRRLNLSRTHVDVASGTRVVINDENYVTTSGLTLCRNTSVVTSTFDITTGVLTSMTDDQATLRFTANVATSSARRGTR
jgi:hypothetical protein